MMRGKCVQSLLCTMVGVMLSMAVLVAPAFADTSYEVAKTSDQTLSSQVSKKFTGWEHTSQGWVYYNKGKKVVGLQRVNDKLYYTTSGARKKMLCGKNTIVNSINDGSLEVFVHPIGNLFSQESIDRWVESRIINSGKKK